jgi:hypothetical protein
MIGHIRSGTREEGQEPGEEKSFIKEKAGTKVLEEREEPVMVWD